MTKQGFGKLATVKEAFLIIEKIVKKTETENVPFEKANGRVIADDIISKIDVPHFRKSAVDGFAVIAENTYLASNMKPKIIRIIESVTAGVLPKKDIKVEECIEITTGASLPKSADAVVMVENTEKIGDEKSEIALYKNIAPGENVVNIGSDVKKGAVVFKKGTILNPRYLGVIAAIGIDMINVMKKPTIAYFSTGNEIIKPGEKLSDGRIFDINSITIVELLRNDNFDITFLGVIPDSIDEIKRALLQKIDMVDIIILSGGSSLGGEDYMVEAVNALGKVYVHGIAAKPGKPVLIGEINKKLVIGLPGYPTSALSNVYTLVFPALYKMMGSEFQTIKLHARLSRKIASTIGRYEFLSVKLAYEDDKVIAIPIMKGSSAITTMAESDGYICIDENTEVVNKDETVEVNLY
jgi:molybdenum cofactor synthesis domain-containing protein